MGKFKVPTDQDLLEIDFSSYKVTELKQILKARSLPVSGRKDELIDRLREHVSAQVDRGASKQSEDRQEQEDAGADQSAETAGDNQTVGNGKNSRASGTTIDVPDLGSDLSTKGSGTIQTTGGTIMPFGESKTKGTAENTSDATQGSGEDDSEPKGTGNPPSASGEETRAKKPEEQPTAVIHITNLVRPFTVRQLQSKLKEFGPIMEKLFWMPVIRNECYCRFETIGGAVAAMEGLHGKIWPDTTEAKALHLAFADQTPVERYMQKVASRRASQTSTPRASGDDGNHTPVETAAEPELKLNEEKKPAATEMGDGQDEVAAIVPVDPKGSGQGPQKGQRPPVVPQQPAPPVSEAVLVLDDLFRFTRRTQPKIYWLPAPPETVAENIRIREREQRRAALRREEFENGGDNRRGSFRHEGHRRDPSSDYDRPQRRGGRRDSYDLPQRRGRSSRSYSSRSYSRSRTPFSDRSAHYDSYSSRSPYHGSSYSRSPSYQGRGSDRKRHLSKSPTPSGWERRRRVDHDSDSPGSRRSSPYDRRDERSRSLSRSPQSSRQRSFRRHRSPSYSGGSSRGSQSPPRRSHSPPGIHRSRYGNVDHDHDHGKVDRRANEESSLAPSPPPERRGSSRRNRFFRSPTP
eukprot:Clim_evm32s227 gene=Clim_evmTU32s227